MKILKSIIVIISLFTAINYAQVSVVVNKSFEGSLNKSDITLLFSGQIMNYSNGDKALLVDQPETEAGKIFYNAMGLNSGQVKVEWTKLVLSGQMKAPIKCSSDDEVKKAVAKNKNALGFILTKNLDDTVKEIYKIK